MVGQKKAREIFLGVITPLEAMDMGINAVPHDELKLPHKAQEILGKSNGIKMLKLNHR
jgi:1,4-dihydroxy-2-naphthoyl-CoA synthase